MTARMPRRTQHIRAGRDRDRTVPDSKKPGPSASFHQGQERIRTKSVTVNTSEELSKAVIAVAGLATDAVDFMLIMEMLGVDSKEVIGIVQSLKSKSK
jgi:hypothetical protein